METEDEQQDDDWALQIALHESVNQSHPLVATPDPAPMEDTIEEQLLYQAPLAASWIEQRHAEDAQLAEDLQVSHVILAEQDALQRAQSAPIKEDLAPGVWDCDACTYRNPPFFPECQACQSKPPTHILTFRRLKVERIRYGLEVEIIVEKGRRDGYSEAWVAEQLSQLGVPTRFAGYSHETSETFWKIVTDSSLQGDQDDLCIEIVSPILQGEAGLDRFRQMLQALRRLGIATNQTCGFHIHVDATRNEATCSMGTLRGRKVLAHAFCCLEGAFDELVARAAHAHSRRTNRNRFCQSNVLNFGARSRQQIWDSVSATTNVYDLVKLVSPEKYYKMNMFNLTLPDRADTVEFRQHGGVEDAVAAEAWVRLVLAFVTRVASQRGPIAMPPQPYNTEYDLQQLFSIVDCPGLESFYTMDRRLYAVSRDTKEWKCRFCGKRFLCSQDLARHTRATNHE